MNKEKLISAKDYLAHKNHFVARKVQRIFIDRIYHRFLEILKGR